MVSQQESSSPLRPTSMAKSNPNRSKSSYITDSVLFVGGAMVALLLFFAMWSFLNPNPLSNPLSSFSTKPKTEISDDPSSLLKCASSGQDLKPNIDPSPNFYDDPNLSYSIEKPMKNWDEKRREWLRQHPSFGSGGRERVLLVSGSQPEPCRNPIGDHLLLRFFKNKVDYCRIHGYDIFYNNNLFHPKMKTFWAKIPAVRSAMIAHPEAEWVYWVDSDAAFTDMEFKLPLEKYKDHNLIVHGWAHLIYEEHSWVGLNAGIFLIRNCQWSMDFMEKWARMGPQTPQYNEWGKTQKTLFQDKLYPESDDQTGLAYLLVKEERWREKVFLESEYYFEGYWLDIVGTLENITEKYLKIEKGVDGLRRRHAEKVSEYYGEIREEYVKVWGGGRGSFRRPFITHFAGCQPCSGDHNELFSGESCWDGMQKALNFADNQVLRSFGFVHKNLLDSAAVSPVPFDFPA
ncbi:galactomannan galactosyltransferase 1-like [Tasmannia lanceolata]|uniref:galactomannan galactosyltransferase 1-like n=1 Tax=Tasmannia lanceolata TaxID=3420 RepID=UPI004064C3B0